MTMPRADNTVRAGEAQKSQERQYGDKQKRHHESLLSSQLVPALTTRIAGEPFLRDMCCVSDRS
jgi:hypothetical protein